jgi:hypothetical protein
MISTRPRWVVSDIKPSTFYSGYSSAALRTPAAWSASSPVLHRPITRNTNRGCNLGATRRACAQYRVGYDLLPELSEGEIEPIPTWTLAPDQEVMRRVGSVPFFLVSSLASYTPCSTSQNEHKRACKTRTPFSSDLAAARTSSDLSRIWRTVRHSGNRAGVRPGAGEGWRVDAPADDPLRHDPDPGRAPAGAETVAALLE